MRLTQISPSAGACDLAATTCSLGSIAAGTQATVRVTATGLAAGAVVVEGEATSQRYDPDLSDNVARTSVVVGSQADVAVAVSVTPETGYVGGDPIVVTYTVTNRGAFEAKNAQLAMDLPHEPVKSITISPAMTGRSCDRKQLTCVLGSVPPTDESGDNAVVIRVMLEPESEANTMAVGEVSATPNADPGNDVAEAAIRVLLPRVTVTPTSGEPGFAVVFDAPTKDWAARRNARPSMCICMTCGRTSGGGQATAPVLQAVVPHRRQLPGRGRSDLSGRATSGGRGRSGPARRRGAR
ncbi:MAG: hypothetical protein JXA67_14645 [Micromonosporaceae bacterium]|nr:hypothetical protein [Micromonosporaceae bacterium]